VGSQMNLSAAERQRRRRKVSREKEYAEARMTQVSDGWNQLPRKSSPFSAAETERTELGKKKGPEKDGDNLPRLWQGRGRRKTSGNAGTQPKLRARCPRDKTRRSRRRIRLSSGQTRHASDVNEENNPFAVQSSADAEKRLNRKAWTSNEKGTGEEKLRPLPRPFIPRAAVKSHNSHKQLYAGDGTKDRPGRSEKSARCGCRDQTFASPGNRKKNKERNKKKEEKRRVTSLEETSVGRGT